MWKWLSNTVKTLRMILKYSSLLVVILGIMTYSADALEKWGKDNLKEEDKKE